VLHKRVTERRRNDGARARRNLAGIRLAAGTFCCAALDFLRVEVHEPTTANRVQGDALESSNGRFRDAETRGCLLARELADVVTGICRTSDAACAMRAKSSHQDAAWLCSLPAANAVLAKEVNDSKVV
jgi:hypothetical protein